VSVELAQGALSEIDRSHADRLLHVDLSAHGANISARRLLRRRSKLLEAFCNNSAMAGLLRPRRARGADRSSAERSTTASRGFKRDASRFSFRRICTPDDERDIVE
jgi:hypothetical protein